MQKNKVKAKGHRATSRKDDTVTAGKNHSKVISRDTARTRPDCHKLMALHDALQDPVSFREGY